MTAVCDACGAKTVQYHHVLTEPIVRALRRLYDVGGGPINLKELGLTRNQWDNFQKLKYFDLVAQHFRDGKRVRGQWVITQLGVQFIELRASVPSGAWTYRGSRTEYDGIPVKADNIIVGYQQEFPQRPYPDPKG